MQVFSYNHSNAQVAESNDTLIIKKVITNLDCSRNLIDESACSLWHYTKCDADKDYCNPYVIGDKIYIQKFISDVERRKIAYFAEVYNSETDTLITTTGLSYEEGTDSQGTGYANFILDTTDIDVQCFYIKITIFNCRLNKADSDALNVCIADLVGDGMTTEEATLICLANYCDPIIIYSEPYCLAPCQNTILLEGYYPGHDCYGQYYGTFTGNVTNSYINQIRVFANIESQNFSIEEVTNNGTKRVSTKLTENFLFRTNFGVPYYVANKIATIFAAKYVYADEVLYTNTNNVEKNNDESSMWFVSTNMVRECGDTDFSCNT